MQPPADLPKHYLSYPECRPKVSKLKKIVNAVRGIVLSPIYWGLAYVVHTPGLRFRKYFMLIGVRLFLKKRDFRNAYIFIVCPLDSVRYFEFEFMWQSLKNMKITSYLDVSSPRLFPLMLIERFQHIFADLINPDKRDLAETVSIAETLGIKGNCSFHADLIENAPLKPNLFELITSMSVIEHIPDDKGAIQKMWDLLRPGGRLLISLPCASKALEEYMNRNDYELYHPDENGFVFFQRFYDEKLLQERVFSVTGKPRRYQIYAEKHAGSYEKNETEKRTNPFYPYWRCPFMMGLQYDFKKRLSELPGIGVIAMEFVKSN